MDLLLLYIPSAVVGWLTTIGVCRIAPKIGAVVQPNPRSSHTYPTPTLGGVGMIAGMWAGLGIAAAMGDTPIGSWRPLACTSIILLFCMDGLRPMTPVEKLVLQVIAGILLVLSGAILNQITLPGIAVMHLGTWAVPFTILWYVSLQNLYDFMDGIDGLAGLEGLLIAAFTGAVALKDAPGLASVAVVLAGGITGFLVLNKPPGKIFMGDVGGQFLGLVFALLAVLGEEAGIPFGLIVLFLGTFLFDSVYTLLRRAFRRENVTKAHRFHLYQRLVRLGWSHASVDGVYATVTILLGLSGHLFHMGSKSSAAVLLVVSMCSMIGGTVWLEARWRKRSPNEGLATRL